eukprot:PLAT6285.1.p3 GENE.PLAT6285.1~~PLAT6285.1.p3  ORF type:complete len:151 (+),score=12.47 PLAT6285.1:461-913(+)
MKELEAIEIARQDAEAVWVHAAQDEDEGQAVDVLASPVMELLALHTAADNGNNSKRVDCDGEHKEKQRRNSQRAARGHLQYEVDVSKEVEDGDSCTEQLPPANTTLLGHLLPCCLRRLTSGTMLLRPDELSDDIDQECCAKRARYHGNIR